MARHSFRYFQGLPIEKKPSDIITFELEISPPYLLLHKRKYIFLIPKKVQTFTIPFANIVGIAILDHKIERDGPKRYTRTSSLLDVMLFGDAGFLMGDLVEVPDHTTYNDLLTIVYLPRGSTDNPQMILMHANHSGIFRHNRRAVDIISQYLATVEPSPAVKAIRDAAAANAPAPTPELPTDSQGRVIL